MIGVGDGEYREKKEKENFCLIFHTSANIANV